MMLKPLFPATAASCPHGVSRSGPLGLGPLPVRLAHAATANSVRCRAQDGTNNGGEGKDTPRGPPKARPPNPKQPVRLPESGFFAQADPGAELYPIRKTQKKDFTERPKDRWESDFIWNTNWQEQLDYEEAQRKKAEEEAAKPAAQAKGGLSFTRVADLNDMSVDLSEQLKPRPKKEKPPPRPQRKRPQQRRPNAYAKQPANKVEKKKWSRGGRYARSAPIIVTEEDLDEEAKAVAEAERIAYEKLKTDFVVWTLSATAVCAATTAAFYSKDTTISYLVGAFGGLTYLRLLNKSVDSYGGGGGLGGTVGQQRLLIPVILTLGFNRWNTLVADDYGVHLSLLPILLGFFTYKGAVVARQGKQVLDDLNTSIKTEAANRPSLFAEMDEEAAMEAEEAAANVDRAFSKRVIQKW